MSSITNNSVVKFIGIFFHTLFDPIASLISKISNVGRSIIHKIHPGKHKECVLSEKNIVNKTGNSEKLTISPIVNPSTTQTPSDENKTTPPSDIKNKAPIVPSSAATPQDCTNGSAQTLSDSQQQIDSKDKSKQNQIENSNTSNNPLLIITSAPTVPSEEKKDPSINPVQETIPSLGATSSSSPAAIADPTKAKVSVSATIDSHTVPSEPVSNNVTKTDESVQNPENNTTLSATQSIPQPALPVIEANSNDQSKNSTPSSEQAEKPLIPSQQVFTSLVSGVVCANPQTFQQNDFGSSSAAAPKNPLIAPPPLPKKDNRKFPSSTTTIKLEDDPEAKVKIEKLRSFSALKDTKKSKVEEYTAFVSKSDPDFDQKFIDECLKPILLFSQKIQSLLTQKESMETKDSGSITKLPIFSDLFFTPFLQSLTSVVRKNEKAVEARIIFEYSKEQQGTAAVTRTIKGKDYHYSGKLNYPKNFILHFVQDSKKMIFNFKKLDGTECFLDIEVAPESIDNNFTGLYSLIAKAIHLYLDNKDNGKMIFPFKGFQLIAPKKDEPQIELFLPKGIPNNFAKDDLSAVLDAKVKIEWN